MSEEEVEVVARAIKGAQGLRSTLEEQGPWREFHLNIARSAIAALDKYREGKGATEQQGYINGLIYAGNLKSRVRRDDNGSAVLNDIRAQIDGEIERVAPGYFASSPVQDD